MTELSRILSSHPDEGATFIIEDKIGVYAAAMVYRDRHPVSGHLRLANPQNPEHVDMLEGWIGRRETPVPTSLNDVGEREESGQERDWRICWEVYCELVDAIKDGRTAPAHPARDPHGQIIPIACKIWTRDLLSLARRRGDAGKAIMALAEANALNETAWPEADPAASEPERQPARSEMVPSFAGSAPPLDGRQELPAGVAPSDNLTNDVTDGPCQGAAACDSPTTMTVTEDTSPPPILNEKNRRDAFLKWAETTYGKTLDGLPGRDDLKLLGRQHVAANINDDDARWLRRHLPRERTKGGAGFHRDKRPS